jgi:hypothetical protein
MEKAATGMDVGPVKVELEGLAKFGANLKRCSSVGLVSKVVK